VNPLFIFLALFPLLGTLQIANGSYGDITLTSPIMVDTSGHALTSLHVNQQIGVESTLTNHGKTQQKFTYLVQVLNSRGGSEYLEGFSASMVTNQSFIASQVWIPKTSGQYTIQVFVWDGLASAIPLTDVIQTQINVEK